MSFSDKLNGKEEVKGDIEYVCDTCLKCKQKYFIHMNIENNDKYVCSYLCSKDLHKKYNNYWDSVINLEDFNKDPMPLLYKKNVEKFKIEISPYDIERYEYHMEMEKEDKYIETLENSSQSSSNSEYDYE